MRRLQPSTREGSGIYALTLHPSKTTAVRVLFTRFFTTIVGSVWRQIVISMTSADSLTFALSRIVSIGCVGVKYGSICERA